MSGLSPILGVMGRFVSPADLSRLVEIESTESSVLEFKRELALDSRAQRAEAMKDLSGMANGGGGTILFGIEENAEGIASAITPLNVEALRGLLEDLTRDAIRPPLLAEMAEIQVERGFILVVDVARSPLGPYMVEAYDERRYYTRIGRSTVPMTEQQIRDAYLLSARVRDRRGDVWDERSLPMAPPSERPWLIVSAVPEEPLVDLFDPANVEPAALKPSGLDLEIQNAYIDGALANPRIWAGGFFGEDGYGDHPPAGVVRLHRDGSLGLGLAVIDPLPIVAILRALNGQLLYLSWLWEKIGLRAPVELDICLENIGGTSTQTFSFSEGAQVSEPPGVGVPRVRIHREVLPVDLGRARARHGLVREFGDRIHQAFGMRRGDIGFTTGWFYGKDGKPLGVSVHGRCLWDRNGNVVGYLYKNGLVERAPENRLIVGFLREGVLIDQEGGTLGVLEFATGAGVPDDFVHQEMYRDPRARTSGDSGAPGSTGRLETETAPLGRWSDEDLLGILRS